MLAPDLKRAWRPVAISAFLLAVSHAPVAVANGGCQRVTGNFSAMSEPPADCDSPVGMCTKGRLRGVLTGSYALRLDSLAPSGHPGASSVQFFTGVSEIILERGVTLTGVDAGALNAAPPGFVGSGAFSTLLTLTDGAAGWLHIRGVLDLATGSVSGQYNGTVCREDA